MASGWQAAFEFLIFRYQVVSIGSCLKMRLSCQRGVLKKNPYLFTTIYTQSGYRSVVFKLLCDRSFGMGCDRKTPNLNFYAIHPSVIFEQGNTLESD